MHVRIAIISLLFILSFLSTAFADESIEIRQRKGFLLLGETKQWLGLRYEYSDHNTGQTSKFSSNKLEEIYHIDTSAAILDFHLFNFSLSGDIMFQQEGGYNNTEGSSSGNNIAYQYSFSGAAFDNRWYPINVFSSRSIDTYHPPFSTLTKSDTGRHGIDFLILKNPYRLELRYERNTQDLKGGGADSSLTSDSITFAGNYDFQDITSTAVNASFANLNNVSAGVNSSGTTWGYGFNNILHMGRRRNYSFTTLLQSLDQTYAGKLQQTFNFSEIFLAHLGEALELQLDYENVHNRNSSTNGSQAQTYDVNTGNFMLRHRLFESLYTTLQANLTQSSFLAGREDKYSGKLDLRYNKKLLTSSILNVDVSGTHEVTDRRLVGSEQGVVNERTNTVTQLNQVITLNIPGPLKPGSVTIEGFIAPPINPQQDPPTLTFTENVDYQVDYQLGRITWIGFPLPVVPNLVISYTVLFDPSLKYATDTGSINAALSLADGKYVLSGYYLDQKQHLISGQSQFGLYNTTTDELRLQGNFVNNTGSLEYVNYKSGPTSYSYFEGWWQYNRPAPRSTIMLMGRDRYTMYGASGNSPGEDINSLNLSASYYRDLYEWLRCNGSLIFLDQRGGRQGSNDSISVRGGLLARFNKLTVNLLGSAGYRTMGKITSRDDYIRVEVKREF